MNPSMSLSPISKETSTLNNTTILPLLRIIKKRITMLNLKKMSKE